MNIVVETEGLRLDQYLTDKLSITRSKVQKLIKDNQILVNGKTVSASYLVKFNDKIDVLKLKVTNEDEINPENIPLDIVYEDDYLLIINKKSGMVVHPAPGNYTHTLVNALSYHFDFTTTKDKTRPGIVHRLDKDTSGLMVVAKNDQVHDLLAKMIKKHEIERKYIALVEGVIMHDTGTIDAPIGRDSVNRQRMQVTDINAKGAITHFKVLKRFAKYTLVECKLETGRTHQIRVHMAYIHHPVANDKIYGNNKKATEFGQLLHSKSIKFSHPVTHQQLYFECDPPSEFMKLVETLTGE